MTCQSAWLPPSSSPETHPTTASPGEQGTVGGTVEDMQTCILSPKARESAVVGVLLSGDGVHLRRPDAF